MNNLNVHIEGPHDNARQNISFNVRYAGGNTSAIDRAQAQKLVNQLREELGKATVSAENKKRVERNLKAIEEETNSNEPAIEEVKGALGSIGKILEAANSLAPTVVTVFQALAQTLGFTS